MIFKPSFMDCATKKWERIHLPGCRIDNFRVVPFPSSLILFRASMVIDCKQHTINAASCISEPNSRTTTV
jgi:hypothetical protein